MDGPKPNDIARCLNALALMNMQDIASADTISDLVNDYFSTRPIGNDESDSDLCESSDDDCECDPELNLFLDEEANGSVNDDSVGVDLTTCVEGLEHLADFVMPRDPAGVDPETVSVFLVTCSCKLNDGQPCHTRYPPEELSDVRLQYGSMTHDELDIAVLAKLSCGMHRTTMTTQSRKKGQKERNTMRTDFYHHGFRICRDVFKSLHGISQNKLTALITHYKVAGVEARVHHNKRKLPANAMKFDDTRAVVNFVVNYAKANAILLPGRTPGHWKSDVKLLPTNCTKKTVYVQYCSSVDAAGTRKASLRTFRRLWRQLLPYIVTMRPATDLCWYCQKGVTKLARSANLPDAEKSVAVRDYEDHLRRATMERSCYNQVCKAAKDDLPPGVTLSHKNITLSFLLTGHTKFSCDWCFGLVKRLYRKKKVDCLQDIVTVVEQSSDVNVAQLCGTESGDVIVPTFDWTTFQGTFFRKVANIKKFHHFHFAEGSTTVRLQECVDSLFLEQSLARRKTPDDVTSDSGICTTRSAPSLQITARTSPHLALLLSSRSRRRVKPRCRTAMMTFHHRPKSQPGDVVEDVAANKNKQTALFRARHNSSFQN